MAGRLATPRECATRPRPPLRLSGSPLTSCMSELTPPAEAPTTITLHRFMTFVTASTRPRSPNCRCDQCCSRAPGWAAGVHADGQWSVRVTVQAALGRQTL